MIALEQSPVQSDPRIVGGTLVFRGTRVSAQTLLDYLDSGEGLESFLEDFPSVEKASALLFLKIAREDCHS
ncbi:DUF433 domain-containing protein [Roseibacillus ishigakijimensis]|uniref:DUF433 domain-containing protein n=1 Tax=Roseibacillus ishigakijimensis TaxID=454146 RepID=A0A934RNK6_9BACT|nr:DUF433 domain-containing protein [Roseibacillus ishigakijimensis]